MRILVYNPGKAKSGYILRDINCFGVLDYVVTPTFLIMEATRLRNEGHEIIFVDEQTEKLDTSKIGDIDFLVTSTYIGVKNEDMEKITKLSKELSIKKLMVYNIPQDRDLFLSKYSKLTYTDFSYVPVKRYGEILLYSSTNCPFNCTFCVLGHRKIIYKPIEEFVNELIYIEDAGAPQPVSFGDPEFTISKDRLQKFHKLYKENNLHISYNCQTRADLIDEETAKLLSETNCNYVYLGIERVSNEELEKINKRMKLEDNIKAIKLLHEYNVKVGGCFIFGFPEDSKDTFKKFKEVIDKLELDRAYVNIFFPYPGTKLYEDIKKTFPEIDKLLLSSGGHQNKAVIPTKFLTKKEVEKYTRYLNNRITVKRFIPIMLKFGDKTIDIVGELIHKIAMWRKLIRKGL